jgi:uncharacterized protein
MANLDGSRSHGGKWDILAGAMLRESPARFTRIYDRATAEIGQFAASDPGRAADAAWAAADTLYVAAAALGSPDLRRAADTFARAARAPYGRVPRPTRTGNELRRAGRLLASTAVVTGHPTLKQIALIVRLVALAQTIGDLRQAQRHAAQAAAARRAAEHLHAERCAYGVPPTGQRDLRGHGESEGRQEELTLSAILNDIRVALAHVRAATGAARLGLIGQSFGGGICGYYAAKRPAEISRLVLLCPQFNYKKRTIDSRPYWVDDSLSDDMAQRLSDQGYIQFTPTLKHGRAIFNEVFWLQPHTVLAEIDVPTLVVHGTKDTLVPIESSREAMARFTAEHKLVEIEGAQHGFAAHDDPIYLLPQSQQWQASVIRTVAEWVNAGW